MGAALLVSAYFYVRSRSADFDRHAEAIAAIGAARHLDERLSELVLSARFGLLNQYDPITSTELGLADASADLRERIADAVTVDGDLADALRRLDETILERRQTVERFKAENSVLKNSLYYLPTAAESVVEGLEGVAGAKDNAETETSFLIHRLVQAALVYNLVGDQSSRSAHLAALANLQAGRASVPAGLQSEFDLLVAHGNVIAQRQVSVDRWVKQVMEGDSHARIDAVEQSYQRHFGEIVASSNRFRKILYGWSIFLVLAVAVAGFELRRLYANLERLVIERTADLRKAVDALWGEMKLARKIQEALVPTSPALHDCEVAATMKATDEVGGDYYDFVQAGDRDWVLIGDVSGHGVPAGLVMMMCHTAVRTVLRQNPDILPDRLLSLVNAVLTENIRQLGEDKYMTITAFRREPDGTVLFAGAHQDVQIYRSVSNTVETLETRGMWLGLKEDISHALTTNQFRLAEGDIALLCTDGITEATRDGALFDTRGVRGVLGSAGGKSARDVLSDVFSALEGYSVKDDATVIVIRQLRASAASAA